MKKTTHLIILLALTLVACAPQQPNQPEETGEIIDDDLTVPLLPNCVQGFGAPVLISPINEIVDPSSPHTFKWSIACIPEKYQFGVFSTETNQVGVILSEFSSNDPEFTSIIQLEPASSYLWAMDAFSGDGDKANSGEGYFMTGPVCGPEVLVAPTLVSPENGSFVPGKGWGNNNEIHTTISYPVGDCIPEGYEIDLSLNPDFSGIDNWNVYSPGPITDVDEFGVHLIGDDTNDLNDCSFYYWRARAYVGNDYGPYSEAFSFYTDLEGECLFVSEFKSLKNANCRSGPWVGENYLGINREGEMASLLGLNEDASWGNFILDNEIECWIKLSLLELQPPGAVLNPAFYPILEHSLAPKDMPIPAEESSPAPEDSSPPEEVSPQGCIAPNAIGKLVCKIPCPDPKYAARVCP